MEHASTEAQCNANDAKAGARRGRPAMSKSEGISGLGAGPHVRPASERPSAAMKGLPRARAGLVPGLTARPFDADAKPYAGSLHRERGPPCAAGVSSGCFVAAELAGPSPVPLNGIRTS
jgi:hypothetical protein